MLTISPAEIAKLDLLKPGLLVIGHGTRDPRGLAEFRAVVAAVADRLPQTIVDHAYLELAEPTIPQGIARMVERGVRTLDIQPLLLFAAGHAKRDLPEQIAAARQSFPQLTLNARNVLGCHPQLVELSALRYREALVDQPPIEPERTALVMVGRGSLDSAATAAMHDFTRQRARQTPVGTALTCFVAMARPSLGETLDQLAGSHWQRIVIQPHLLFRGQLLDDIGQAVRERQAARKGHTGSDPRWIITGQLGVHPLLVDALLSVDPAKSMPDCSPLTIADNDLAPPVSSG